MTPTTFDHLSTLNSEDDLPLEGIAEQSLTGIKQIITHIPMAITITDTQGCIEYCNPHFTEITGYHLDDVVGKNPSILSYQTTPPEVYAELWHTISQGNTWQGKLVNKRKNNDRYLAEVKIVPLKNNAGDVVFYIGMQKDISDSHVIKAERSNQEKTISAILNTVPSALALIDHQEKVLLDNLAYKTLTTDFKEEPAHLAIKQLKLQLNLSPDQPISAIHFSNNKSINIVLETPNNKRWFKCRLLDLEVSDVDIEQYFSPQTSALVLLTITEFTHEKVRAERHRVAELQKMTAETEMVHGMQETMHAVLHQLQGPVNMIASAVGLMHQQTERYSGLNDAINMALDAGNEALLQLRNALPERSPEAPQLTNINQVLHDLSQMTTSKLLYNSIELNLSLTATLPSITAQPSRLRVAFKKIVDNAIDSISFNRCPEREIVIKTRAKDDGIMVIFEDSGIGIEKNQRFKVFQPFYTTKPSNLEGTRGIGLTIVQQVINEHRGTIEFKASKLGGSQVCVFIPKH